MKIVAAVHCALLCVALPPAAVASQTTTPLRQDQIAFTSIFKELVETNTTLSSGDCTLAANRMAAHLRSAGFPESDLHLIVPPGHPKEGNLVAILPGRDRQAKAVLMLAHIDVVEAKREDWARDPFTLIEENGYFYARGVADDKAQAAIWVDTLARFKRDGFKPRRTLKLALTCGEETNGALNGAKYLVENHRQLIDAAFAVNEGGGGLLDAQGKPALLAIQVGEKLTQNYTLTVTNPGGHSSRPSPDNAIYHLANALRAIERHRFPITFNNTTRDFFTRLIPVRPPEQQAAIKTLLANPEDAAARAVLERDLDLNGLLQTTCIPTTVNAGHATNALPQRATANVNCRIFPGSTVEEVQKILISVIDNPLVSVAVPEIRNALSPVPPLDPKVLGPAEKLASEMWPGVPNFRVMIAGATDGAFLNAAGIPTYGISGLFADPDGGGIHGLNERIRVRVLHDMRDYLYRLMKEYAVQSH